MRGGPRMIGSRPRKRHGLPSRGPLGTMAGGCARPSITRMPHSGCASSPRSPSYAGYGAKTIGGTARRCTGVRRTPSRRRRSLSAHPTTPQPTTLASTPRRGWATKCISRKAVRMTCRTCLLTWKPPAARWPMARQPLRFMRRGSSGASCPGPIASIPVFWTRTPGR